jgi:hypothetical protein
MHLGVCGRERCGRSGALWRIGKRPRPACCRAERHASASRRGRQTVEDVALDNAHDARHHIWDTERSTGSDAMFSIRRRKSGCSDPHAVDPVSIPHDIENRGVTTGTTEPNPQVNAPYSASAAGHAIDRLNLSRWRHGFKSRWDYWRPTASSHHPGPAAASIADRNLVAEWAAEEVEPAASRPAHTLLSSTLIPSSPARARYGPAAWARPACTSYAPTPGSLASARD